MAQKEKKWTAPDREAGECTTYGRLRSNPTKHEYSILMYDPPARLQVHTKRPIGCILTGQARIPMRALTHIASFVETWIWTNHRHACHAHPGPPTDAAARALPARARRLHQTASLATPNAPTACSDAPWPRAPATSTSEFVPAMNFERLRLYNTYIVPYVLYISSVPVVGELHKIELSASTHTYNTYLRL